MVFKMEEQVFCLFVRSPGLEYAVTSAEASCFLLLCYLHLSRADDGKASRGLKLDFNLSLDFGLIFQL